MDEPGVVLRVVGSTTFAVVGIVADVSAVVLLALSEDVRQGVSQNPIVALAVTGASVLLTLILINVLTKKRASELRLRAKNQQLETQLQDLRRMPVDADIKRWNEFSADFGRDSQLYIWLKERFYTSHAWERDFNELEKVCLKWHRDPSGYYDSEAQESFSILKGSAIKLHEVLASKYWVERIPGENIEIGKRRLAIPPEWDYEKKDEAIAVISAAFDELMAHYERFSKVAKDKRLAGTETGLRPEGAA